jgi:hypothetical protein
VADAPWRCSQCGTVNEPVANACRTCGRWPSLFDLERSTIGQEREPVAVEDEYRHEAPPPREMEIPLEPVDVEYTDYSGAPEEPEREPARPWPQRIGSLIVPILVLLYVLISIVTNR